ncbi:MAG: hypothetical protein HY661_20275 [Betaproteobacteria bacterium]|nr:hypothetical protein [Betaproteobacteria bacterium]
MDVIYLHGEQRKIGGELPALDQEAHAYGSEFHLLRYLGRHRNHLNKQIVALLGCDQVRWLDFPTGRDRQGQPYDAQWKQLDFLPAGSPARKSWPEFWPQSAVQQNWDAVGVAAFKHGDDWLLVEAKAYKGELKSSCGAEGGRSLIEQSLRRTKQRLGVFAGRDWLNGYHQYCNRLALLNFLAEKGVSARLLSVYFIGNEFSDWSAECPTTAEQWNTSLSEMDRHVGLPSNSPLKARVHRLFLPVFPSRSN